MVNPKSVRSQKMTANNHKNLVPNAEIFIRQARRLELKIENLRAIQSRCNSILGFFIGANNFLGEE
ncbi:MAG: hypothetical protein AAF579_15700 [Cyanobacteria bacterium P01_C01_bin.118]